jgi:FtsP/CotA-like multicopper oxidase with cupredoxin domain
MQRPATSLKLDRAALTGIGSPIVFVTCLSGLALTGFVQPAMTQEIADRILTSPPVAQIFNIGPNGTASARSPLTTPSLAARLPSGLPAGRERSLDLDITYTDSTIYNPATNRQDAVHLRSYRDAHSTIPPKVPFVAPTIEVAPGDTVRISLNNRLPADDPSCPGQPGQPDIPHCFNHTNLHSHGLWVSPTGNSDNVLIDIAPSVSFQYEYNVPLDHPSGTFWYHPHLHGSTALQVSSGMAGILLIKGDRLPTPQSNGDIDTLLQEPYGGAVPERLLLLQQIQYACNGGYDCKPGEVGGIESYDLFGPGTWPASGRYTTINGTVLPTFPGAQVGRLERWRFVHAGVRDTVKVQLRKMKTGAAALAALAPADQDSWIAQNCPGAPLSQFAIASDGLTRGAITERDETVLQPGYREDLLVLFPEAGSYCVIDDAAPANASVNGQVKSRKLLGQVNVGVGEPVGSDLRAALQAQLIAAAGRTMPADIRPKVVADLKDGLKLTSFIPHPDVADDELTGKQNVQLKIDTSGPTVKFEVDGKPYDPSRIDRTLPLGGVDEWTLTAGTNPPVGHPFHIHVNPFQIARILNPQGVDVSVTGESDDPQYAALKGVWKDTIFVKPGYQVITRTRYQRYIGEFVLHCHILDHEDQGMMQNVLIALPDGHGGVAALGHH